MNVPKKPPTHAHVALRQTPRVLQPKTVLPQPQVKRPAAPPAYRPQPVPKVLQTKTAVVRQPPLNQPQRKPVAPPVYRPEQKRIVQPKIMSRPQNPRSHGTAIQCAAAVAASPASASSRYVNMGEIAVSTGRMHTDKLFNCIAVVAYHEASGYAAFTHYNTAFAFRQEPTGEENEFGDPKYRDEVDVEGLKRLKRALLEKLNQTANVDFYIMLGDVWKDEKLDTEGRRIMKRDLIQSLRDRFNPAEMDTVGSLTATWDRTPFPGLSK